MTGNTTRRRIPTVVLAAVVPVVAVTAVIVTLAATPEPSPSAAVGRGGTDISIENFTFSPRALRVDAGTTVKVTNADGAAHTLTALDGEFDTGTLDGGQVATVTIDRAGTYRYYCDIHNYMTGRIEAT